MRLKVRQWKLGKWRKLATVSPPDTCTHLARLAARVNSLQGGDIHRIYDLVKTVRGRQQVTVLKYTSTSRPKTPARGDVDERMRAGGKKFLCNAMTLVGWSDAVYGNRLPGGKCPLGYAVGLTFSTLRGPCFPPLMEIEFYRGSGEK